MKRFPFSRLALALLLGAGSFAVAAQSVEAEAEAIATDEAKAEAAADADVDRTCLRSTGSRIVAARNEHARRTGTAEAKADPAAECTIASGRVITRRDLEDTGYTSVAEALRALEPRIR